MMKSKYKVLFICLLIGLSLANLASADLVTCGGRGDDPAGCGIQDLIFLIERIINFLLSWAWIIAIFYIMWSGYNMVFAGGDSEQIQNAKTQFSHAIIGFVLIMCAYLLINWIVGIFSGDGSLGPGQFEFFKGFLFQ